MTAEIQVRKARFKDADTIADFVNKARPGSALKRIDVAERFSQVGFVLAESNEQMVGLVGFQVENLVIRITDFLVAPVADRVAVGRMLIAEMEQNAHQLEAEAAMLFLPANPSRDLLAYWESFGYKYRAVTEMPKVWREAANEWDKTQAGAIVKQIRQDMVRRPV